MGGMNEVTFRRARRSDGKAIHALVERAGTLEANTAYCYLLLADHFGSTSVVAEVDGEIVGTVVGYRPPSRPDALFVWQVGVDSSMRGRGLGLGLLRAFTRTPGARGARVLQATVAPSNVPSNKLFSAFARSLEATLKVSEGYPSSLFPEGHEDERLITIHPLPAHAAVMQEVSP